MRRELRSLSSEDRERFIGTMQIYYSNNDQEGKSHYGGNGTYYGCVGGRRRASERASERANARRRARGRPRALATQHYLSRGRSRRCAVQRHLSRATVRAGLGWGIVVICFSTPPPLPGGGAGINSHITRAAAATTRCAV